MQRAGDAFTLLEVLVAVVITGLLASLAIAGYGKVANIRDQSESASRLRLWGVALGGYVSDHDGDLPRRGQGVQPVTILNRPEDWFNALPPYVGQESYWQRNNTFHRPLEGERSMFVRPGARDPGGIAFLSYGMNMNLSPWNVPSPTRLAQIERPALTVFLAESPGTYASTYPSKRPHGCIAPHNGKGNILFLDGHVAAFEANYLGVGKGDPKRDDVRWLTGTISDAQSENYR